MARDGDVTVKCTGSKDGDMECTVDGDRVREPTGGLKGIRLPNSGEFELTVRSDTWSNCERPAPRYDGLFCNSKKDMRGDGNYGVNVDLIDGA